jgi:hypothetical protein
MARRSKKVQEHEQLPLFKPRGGKRRGAGRKARGRRASERHKKRSMLNARHPVHVVLRVVAEVGNLRRRRAYRAIREATWLLREAWKKHGLISYREVPSQGV